MRNITLSVDEGVLRAVRRYAADHDSTVNAMVREYLTDIAERESRVSEARKRIKHLAKKSKMRLGEKSWTRGELHDR